MLLERNYVLYHAADPSLGGLGRIGSVAGRGLRHGIKQIRAGRLSPLEWTCSVAGVTYRLPALFAKAQRDRRQSFVMSANEPKPEVIPLSP